MVTVAKTKFRKTRRFFLGAGGAVVSVVNRCKMEAFRNYIAEKILSESSPGECLSQGNDQQSPKPAWRLAVHGTSFWRPLKEGNELDLQKPDSSRFDKSAIMTGQPTVFVDQQTDSLDAQDMKKPVAPTIDSQRKPLTGLPVVLNINRFLYTVF
jgi:hypothetical protein